MTDPHAPTPNHEQAGMAGSPAVSLAGLTKAFKGGIVVANGV